MADESWQMSFPFEWLVGNSFTIFLPMGRFLHMLKFKFKCFISQKIQ